jgi:hypothetical protein
MEATMARGSPATDHELASYVRVHSDAAGQPHRGRLYIVARSEWDNPRIRARVEEQIAAGGSRGLDEASEGYYDTRSQLSSDALACYAKHLRPEKCSDYLDSRMDVYPDTGEARRDVGLPKLGKRSPGPRASLCHFCPIHSKNSSAP